MAVASMSLATDGTRASVIDSERRCAPVRSRRPVAARRVRAVLQDSGDVGGRPRLWGGRVQRDIRPLWRSLRLPPNRNARCRRRGPLGCEDLRGPGRTAADVEYSADGSLFAALAASTGFQSPGRIALWRGGAGDPVLLDLDVSGLDPQPAGQFGAVKFSPDGSRLYASGFGPTVVFETATGQELHRIAGNGILAVSPDGTPDRGARWLVRGAHHRLLRGRSHPSPSRCRPFPRRPTSVPTVARSPSPPAPASWWRAPRPARSRRRSAVMTVRSPRSSSGRRVSWSRPERTARSSRGISATGRRAFATTRSSGKAESSSSMSAPSRSNRPTG